MSSIPRGPHHDDAAEPPTPGANLPRPSLDQTLVGVAPTVLPTATATSAPATSPAEAGRDAEPPSTADKSKAILATPMIAVSGSGSQQKLDEPVERGGGNVPGGVHRADADPGLQSTALASDFLQGARDAALRKASVPRPRRSAPREEPSPVTLHAIAHASPPEPPSGAPGGAPLAAPPGSIGTQASVAPPLEAALEDDAVKAPSPLPPNVAPSSTLTAQGSAPAQPPFGRFEPVPTVRAPLWEQAPPSVGRPLPVDGAPPDWPPLHGAASLRASAAERSGWYRLRWVALAAAALAAVAFAVFGEHLTRTPEGRVKLGDTAPASNSTTKTPPDQTLLANHPASGPAAAPVIAELPASAPAASEVSAAGAPTSKESARPPVVALANDTPTGVTSKRVAASKTKKKPVKRSKAKRKPAATAAPEEPTNAAAEPTKAAPEPEPGVAK